MCVWCTDCMCACVVYCMCMHMYMLVCVCILWGRQEPLCEIGILIVGKLKFYLLAINQVSAGKHSGKCGKFDAVSAQLQRANFKHLHGPSTQTNTHMQIGSFAYSRTHTHTERHTDIPTHTQSCTAS